MSERKITVSLTEFEWEQTVKALGLMTALCCATKGALADATYQSWYNLTKRVRSQYHIRQRIQVVKQQ
jgi:hypothetical protein